MSKSPVEVPFVGTLLRVVGAANVTLMLAIASWHAWHLPAAWLAWRAGQPDRYPGEIAGAVSGHVSGLCLSLAVALGSWPLYRPESLLGRGRRARIAVQLLLLVLSAVATYLGFRASRQ